MRFLRVVPETAQRLSGIHNHVVQKLLKRFRVRGLAPAPRNDRQCRFYTGSSAPAGSFVARALCSANRW